MPTVFRRVKKGELFKMQNEVTQDLIEQGIGYQQGEKTQGRIKVFFKGSNRDN